MLNVLNRNHNNDYANRKVPDDSKEWDKEILPQLGSNGVCYDYANEFWGIVAIYQIGQMKSLNGVKYLEAYLKKHPMKLYQERFSEFKYRDVVTDFNRDRIARINNITIYINHLASLEELTLEDLKASWRELSLLIFNEIRPVECPFSPDKYSGKNG